MCPDELGPGDFFLIAEAILDVPAKQLANVARIPGMESALAAPFASFDGVYFYPDPIARAAICCSRIIRNHPLPDGNKRVGYECMREMFDRSGIEWPRPGEDAPLIAMMIEGLAARTVSEPDFITWVKDRVENKEEESR